MYSSPLLLLVMVITLPSHPSTHVAQRSANDARVVTTTTLESTTTTITQARSTVTPTLKPRFPTEPVARDATTSVPKRLSAVTTNLTVSPSDSGPSANVASGEVEGLVSPASPVAVIPLVGPGVWTITTSSPSVNLLVCATTSRPVDGFVALLTEQNCQLQVTSATSGASLTWLLTPAP